MGYIVIWRKSIQKKKGHCPRCGYPVVGPDGFPNNNCGIAAADENKKEKALWCIGCKKEKNMPFILGTVKEVDNAVIDAGRMYDGVDWDKAEKYLNKTVEDAEKKYLSRKEMEQKMQQLEFDNGVLKGQVNNLKRQRDDIVQAKDHKIRDLSAELKHMEHLYDALAKEIMLGQERE